MGNKIVRILAICSYPAGAAATRFRVGQYVGPLRERGIEVELSPFLSGEQFARLYRPGNGVRKAAGLVRPLFHRVGEVLSASRYDLLLVQREAMFFGPEIFERLFQKVGNLPMVLDLDDATYVRYESPTYGSLGSAMKFFGKTDRLISRAAAVICGNRFIAEYVGSKGVSTAIVPTVVDTGIFRPAESQNEVPVIGWIGTHSTFPSVQAIFPVLERLAQKHRFVLRVVGSGKEEVTIPGVEVVNLPWSMEREVEDFRRLDIGLYPISVSPSANELWIKGKSGFKAIQYMAVGVPFVMSPVGVCAEIGEPNRTHFQANCEDDWYNALDKLLSSKVLRDEMGAQGRAHSLENYTVEKQSAVLADILLSVANK